MSNPLTNLSLPIRLALRDLAKHKGRALGFALLLTSVLGLLIPTLMTARLSAIEVNADEHLAQAPAFAESSAPGSLLVTTFTSSLVSPQELRDSFPPLGELDSIALVPATSTMVATISGEELFLTIPAAAFSEAPLSQTLTAVQGRLPGAAGEIAIDLSFGADYPELEPSLGAVTIGDPLEVLTDLGPVTLKVVGTFVSNLPPSARGLGPVIAGENTFKLTEDTYVQGFGFNKTELPIDTAVEIARGFVNKLEPFSLSAPTSSPENAQEYAHQFLLLPGQSDQAATPFQAIALTLTLLFAAVVGIPLFTLSAQNRHTELFQLRRAGMGSFPLWISLLVSALLIAVTAAAGSIMVALGTLALRFPDLPRHIVFSGEIVAGICVLGVVGAVVPAVIAASIPAVRTLQKMEHSRSNMAGSSANSHPEAGSSNPAAKGWIIATFTTGATLLIFGIVESLSGVITNSSLTLFVCGAIAVLIGVYLVVPRLLVVLTHWTQNGSLPLRLAMRELSRRPTYATNSIVPVAFVSAAITMFGVISRQHFLENARSVASGYAMIFPLLAVPIISGILIIGLTLGARTLGLGQLNQDRTALLNMGQDPVMTGKSEGFRAATIAGLGTTLGTFLGVLLAMAVLVLRAASSRTWNLELGAVWAWETYLLAAILPTVVCYALGKAAGGTSYQASLVSQP